MLAVMSIEFGSSANTGGSRRMIATKNRLDSGSGEGEVFCNGFLGFTGFTLTKDVSPCFRKEFSTTRHDWDTVVW